MIYQAKSLLSDAARQLLWESFDRHGPDPSKPDEDLGGVRVVLDAFPGCPYGVDESLPRSRVAD